MHDLCRVGCCSEVLVECGELLLECLLISSRCFHLYVDILDVACFVLLLEDWFEFFIFCLEVFVGHLYLFIIDVRVRECCELYVALLVLVLVCHLC